MPEAFDPYLKWLAILPEEQPPNHYRLLAVPLFLDDADVIENAADQRMAHVRTFGMGKHADLSQKLLNEISAAKVLLLDPVKKAEYDKKLRAKRASEKQSPGGRPKLKTRKTTESQTATAAASAKQRPNATAKIEVTPRESSTASRTSRRHKKPLWQKPATLAVTAILLITIATLALMLGGKKDNQIADRDKTPNTKQTSQSNSSERTTDTPAKQENQKQIAKTPPDDPSSRIDSNPPDESTPLNSADSTGPPETTPPSSTTDGSGPPVEFNFGTTDKQPPETTSPPIATISGTAKPPAAQNNPSAKIVPDKKRLPVPDEASLEAKQELIAELYGDQIKAARTKDAKAELTQVLLDAARKTENDPVGKYALLSTALEHAIDSGSVELATDCTGALAEEFDVDALRLNTDTLTSVARKVSDKEQRAGVVGRMIELAEETIQADRFDDAEKLSKLIASATRSLREAELTKASNSLRARIRLFKASWEASQQAVTTLEEQPENREAHLALGKYLALVKQDWQAGLAHLAKGSDAALAAVAQQEAASPEAADDRLAIANRWYNWAQRASGAEQEGALVRALHWYQDVVGEVASQQAPLVNQRIDELSAKVKPIKSGVARLPWIKGPVGLIGEFEGNKRAIGAFDISAEGRYVLTGSQDQSFRIIDLSTGQEKRVTTSAYGYPAVFTHDGVHFLAMDGWSGMSLFDWKTGARKWTIKPNARPSRMTLIPDKPLALITMSDKTARIYNYTTGKEEFQIPRPEGTGTFAVTPDGRRALLGQTDSRVSIYDMATGKVLHELTPYPDTVKLGTKVAVSGDGKWGVCSITSYDPAHIFNLQTGKLVMSLKVDRPTDCDFSPDGQRVALAGRSSLDVWQLKTNTLLHRFDTKHIYMSAVRFTPDGRAVILTNNQTGAIYVYRISDPE